MGNGLKRFVRRPGVETANVVKELLTSKPTTRPGEACEMCGESIPEDHPHVVNVETRNLMCTCRGCYLLFTAEGAAQGKYRCVPERYLYDPHFVMTAAQWDDLQIPVKLAFFFFNSSMDRFVAFYPSPAGATESLLDLAQWNEVLAANPQLPACEPDVEAFLIAANDDGFECFLVPIDACYELVGRVKLNWKGFDGGEEAWSDIAAFFADLRARSLSLDAGETA